MTPRSGKGRHTALRPLVALPSSLVLALLLSACGGAGSGGGSSPTATPNVSGVVLTGPQCPVVQAEKPCPDKPAADVAVTFTPAAGGRGVTARAGADGRFAVALAPGAWVALVQADPAKGVMSAKPEDVTVPASGTLDVTLHGDTGIR